MHGQVKTRYSQQSNATDDPLTLTYNYNLAQLLNCDITF